jgi:hypothetical protein
VVENAIFSGAARASDLVVPWTTFTEPEVAHVGVYGDDALHDTFTSQLAHNDRAICEGETEGFVRVHCLKGTQTIVGATIVAAAAGEMISELTLAIQYKIPLGARGVGGVIHCYPTVADAIGGASWGYKMANWRKVERVMGPGGSEPVTLRVIRDGAGAVRSSSSGVGGVGAAQAVAALAVLGSKEAAHARRWRAQSQ